MAGGADRPRREVARVLERLPAAPRLTGSACADPDARIRAHPDRHRVVRLQHRPDLQPVAERRVLPASGQGRAPDHAAGDRQRELPRGEQHAGRPGRAAFADRRNASGADRRHVQALPDARPRDAGGDRRSPHLPRLLAHRRGSRRRAVDVVAAHGGRLDHDRPPAARGAVPEHRRRFARGGRAHAARGRRSARRDRRAGARLRRSGGLRRGRLRSERDSRCAAAHARVRRAPLARAQAAAALRRHRDRERSGGRALARRRHRARPAGLRARAPVRRARSVRGDARPARAAGDPVGDDPLARARARRRTCGDRSVPAATGEPAAAGTRAAAGGGGDHLISRRLDGGDPGAEVPALPALERE